MSRVPLLEMDAIPESHHHLFTEDYLGDRHIFRAWAHNPEVLEATLEYLNVLYDQLTTREKELVILTVAREKTSKYEWHQHVDIARDLGVTTEDIRAIGRADLDHFEHREASLLAYAERTVAGTVRDEDYDHLNRHYDHGQIVAIGLLVGFYTGLCNYIAATDLPFEGGDFVGWEPADETVAARFD
jgi:4-carboxymuconolactone decarboxylase